MKSVEATIVNTVDALAKYLDGKTTKTEVINQIKSVSTPDVEKVVDAISKLDSDVMSNKIDLKPLVDILTGVKREVSLIPKSLPKFEQKDSVKVSNLSEIDFSDLEKAIKNIKFTAEPKVEVKAPIINVEKMDIKPLQDELLNVVKYLKALKPQKTVEISNLSEIKATDTTLIEKKLDESNKHLKTISEKKFGGGGGGGNGSPYIDATGTTKNVVLEADGSIPVNINNLPDVQLAELIPVMRAILTAIANPAYVDKSANQMRAQVTGSVTVSSTSINNIGSFPGDHLQRMDNMTAWATNVRSLIA